MPAEQMTSRERVRAALFGEPVDRLPFSPFLAYVWEHMPKETQDAGQLAFHHRTGCDPLWRGGGCPVKAILPEGMSREEFEEDNLMVTATSTPVGTIRSARMKSEEGDTAFLIEHPLKTEEDYKVRMWIEENTKYEPNPDTYKNHMEGNGKEGYTLGMLIPRAKSAYQDMVEFFVGTEELVYAQMDYPDTVRSLWQQMVDNDLKAVHMAVESEFECFITWEDSSTQNYSPSQYDEFIGSEIGQWCDLLKAADKCYVQHACGHVAALTERMRDHGTFAIESISPPPTGNLSIRDARAMVGDTMGIIGGIEPTLFLSKTEDELPAYVEEVIAEGAGGPFVLANSDSCPPGVTEQKFRIVAETAKRVTQS